MTGSLIIEEHGGVVLATIDNPERLNALDLALRAQLTKFWREFAANSSWNVAVLTGSGNRAFCAGRDLKETAASYSGKAKLEFEHTREMGYPHLTSTAKPTIAAVNGHAVGGGLMMAMGCTIRVCTPSAKFGLPQAARGRGTQMPLHLKRAGIPQGVIMDMAISGESIGAERAYQLGFVSRMYPDRETMIEQALALAERVGDNAQRVVRGIAVANESGVLDLPLNDALPLWNSVTGGSMTEDEETRKRTVDFVERR